MDRLAAMRVFLTVAQQESFAEAARMLRLSPSVATRTVAALEAELGVVLLNRTTRSVRLTERGSIYAERCRQILEDVAGADLAARGEAAEPSGRLHVAASVLFGRLHVLPIVEQVLTHHPGLSVRLVLSDRNVHLAEEGVDIAVRIGRLADSSLKAVRFGEVSRVLVASPSYLATHGPPATPAELAHRHVIAFEGLDFTDEWRFGAPGGLVRVEPRLLVNSAEAAVRAAEDGHGITRALSYQVQAGLEAGRLALVLPDYARDRLPVSAVYLPRRAASRNLEAFMTAARAYFRSHPIVAI